MAHLKMFAVVGAVIGVFAATSSASATILTSGGAQVPAGTAIQAKLVGVAEWTNGWGFTMTCGGSEVNGKTLNAGSSTETVKIEIGQMSFTSCGSGCMVQVLAKGTWELHTDGAEANGNGTLTANGQELTTLGPAGVCFALYPRYTHCIWKTSNSDYGTIVGGAPATIEVNTTTIRSGGISGMECGGNTGTFKATYEITTPTELFVD